MCISIEVKKKFVPSIKCLYQPEASLLEEPHDIENAPFVPNTLQIHRLVREIGDDKATISIFNLSCDVDPVCLKDFKNIHKCSHIEKEFQSFAMMINTFARCTKFYVSEKDLNEDWLKCAVWLQWFYASCFHS